jgi:hypothetical protein
VSGIPAQKSIARMRFGVTIARAPFCHYPNQQIIIRRRKD